MSSKQFNLEEEQKRLVLERFKTLRPESKILLGSYGEITVNELIKHIENKNDPFGKKIIQVQIKMLKILASGVQ